MADIKYYDVILKPVITEKSMAGMGEKKYTFLVHPEANKSQIKEAVEKMFEGTKVASVNTVNMDGKNKRRGMVVGKTAKTKNFATVMSNLNVNKGLVVIAENDANVVLSARNMANVNTTLVNTMNTYDVMKAQTVVLTKDAVAKIEEVYA